MVSGRATLCGAVRVWTGDAEIRCDANGPAEPRPTGVEGETHHLTSGNTSPWKGQAENSVTSPARTGFSSTERHFWPCCSWLRSRWWKTPDCHCQSACACLLRKSHFQYRTQLSTERIGSFAAARQWRWSGIRTYRPTSQSVAWAQVDRRSACASSQASHRRRARVQMVNINNVGSPVLVSTTGFGRSREGKNGSAIGSS